VSSETSTGTQTWPPEERSSEALSFLKNLWGIAPKEWFAEFDFLTYTPTLENPDAKRMTAMFSTLEQVFEGWDAIFRELEKANRTQVANIHHCTAPRFQKPKKGHGKNIDVSHLVCAWVDVDFDGQETSVRKVFFECVEDLRKLGLGPSYIVESGHGLHGYWLFDISFSNCSILRLVAEQSWLRERCLAYSPSTRSTAEPQSGHRTFDFGMTSPRLTSTSPFSQSDDTRRSRLRPHRPRPVSCRSLPLGTSRRSP